MRQHFVSAKEFMQITAALRLQRESGLRAYSEIAEAALRFAGSVKSVVDLGCGFAGLSPFIKRGGVTYTGVDRLRYRTLLDHGDFCQDDASAHVKMFSYDLYLLVDVIGYGAVEDNLELLRTIGTRMRPGNCIIVDWPKRPEINYGTQLIAEPEYTICLDWNYDSTKCVQRIKPVLEIGGASYRLSVKDSDAFDRYLFTEDEVLECFSGLVREKIVKIHPLDDTYNCLMLKAA